MSSIVNIILNFLKKPQKSEVRKVVLNKYLLLLGSIGATVFLIPAVISAITDKSLWVTAGLFAFSIDKQFSLPWK